MTLETTTYRGERWEAWLSSPAPGVLWTRLQGQLELPAVERAMAAFEAVAADVRPVAVFHDWEGVEGYTPDARQVYVDWSKRHRADVELVHILLRSKLVAMGVTVANLALGFLVPHTTRDTFERERLAAVVRARAASRRSSPPARLEK